MSTCTEDNAIKILIIESTQFKKQRSSDSFIHSLNLTLDLENLHPKLPISREHQKQRVQSPPLAFSSSKQALSSQQTSEGQCCLLATHSSTSHPCQLRCSEEMVLLLHQRHYSDQQRLNESASGTTSLLGEVSLSTGRWRCFPLSRACHHLRNCCAQNSNVSLTASWPGIHANVIPSVAGSFLETCCRFLVVSWMAVNYTSLPTS
mmetsp:Transcript_58323/g.92591  ORF Transcript_58323/g.92591 Transcript_58323/m.92591 type:complete len:205 (+) Transcript_58323:138-752(+)